MRTISRLFAVMALLLTAVTANAQEQWVIELNDGTRSTFNIDDIRQMYTAVGAVDDTHESVDLGLSVKWAKCNLGAARPEEYGDYFAWGETAPKSDYSWSTYKYFNSSNNSLTRYCTESDYGTVDNKTVLDPEDDAAHVNWGGDWRMPTDEELQELTSSRNCTWTWYDSDNTEFGGIAGYKVTSRKSGYEGNFIFLPAAGYLKGTDPEDVGSCGIYWSGSLFSDDVLEASDLDFGSDYFSTFFNGRNFGQTVRPVCPK